MCKLRLVELAATADSRADFSRRFQEVGPFHVDFVLCDTQTTAPLLVIELDDRSHDDPHRINRDSVKDAVLCACGLPIYRAKCQQAYAPLELSEEIARRVRPHGTGSVLTREERALWRSLRQAVHDQYLVFCKVRLADIAAAPDHQADSGRRFRDIATLHVDFVVCETRTTAPLMVIELEGRSPVVPRRRNRDRFKEAVLKAAGLPVYRLNCHRAYGATELSEEISRRISSRIG